jgi:hypothetical protein
MVLTYMAEPLAARLSAPAAMSLAALFRTRRRPTSMPVKFFRHTILAHPALAAGARCDRQGAPTRRANTAAAGAWRPPDAPTAAGIASHRP